jgi:VCBS repeat-containing protein
VNADGSFSYTPALNYSGPDSFTYKATNLHGDSSVATVALTVNHVDQPPVAHNDSYSTNENTALTVSAPGVLANDTDVDSATLTAALVTGASHGSLVLNADGSFRYTPASNYYGSDSFTYKASDGQLWSNPATVTLTINHINQPPVGNNDAYSVAKNATLTISPPGVLLNDTDPDGDPLTATLVASPGHGSLKFNSNGSFTYTPRKNFTGTDQFTYKASDGRLFSNVATVTITVASTARAAALPAGGSPTAPPITDQQGAAMVRRMPVVPASLPVSPARSVAVSLGAGTRPNQDQFVIALPDRSLLEDITVARLAKSRSGFSLTRSSIRP